MTMRAMSGVSQRKPRSSMLLAAALIAFLGLAVGPAAHPAPVAASTATNMEALIVKWVNQARVARGVPALTVGPRLTVLAGARSATLARTATLVHPSCLSCVFRSYGIPFSICGENIAMTSYPWGWEAARSIFLAWKGSPSHWTILMSRSFHRIGIGVSYRSANRTTWAAAELAG